MVCANPAERANSFRRSGRFPRGTSMIDRRIGCALAAAVLAASGLGCASASVKSNKSAEYTKKLERTLIVFPLDERLKHYEPLLQERLVGEIPDPGAPLTLAKATGHLEP